MLDKNCGYAMILTVSTLSLPELRAVSASRFRLKGSAGYSPIITKSQRK